MLLILSLFFNFLMRVLFFNYSVLLKGFILMFSSLVPGDFIIYGELDGLVGIETNNLSKWQRVYLTNSVTIYLEILLCNFQIHTLSITQSQIHVKNNAFINI